MLPANSAVENTTRSLARGHAAAVGICVLSTRSALPASRVTRSSCSGRFSANFLCSDRIDMCIHYYQEQDSTISLMELIQVKRFRGTPRLVFFLNAAECSSVPEETDSFALGWSAREPRTIEWLLSNRPEWQFFCTTPGVAVTDCPANLVRTIA